MLERTLTYLALGSLSFGMVLVGIKCITVMIDTMSKYQ